MYSFQGISTIFTMNNMLRKFDGYWSVIHDIMGVATILDPRYKMGLLEYYFDKLYDLDCYNKVTKI